MTCEVAVLNKLGIAVATDSAVTVGRNHKVYHSAQKLFQLSTSEPVAIATYGAASILGVPWELLIKTYRTRLGAHRFDYLEQYRDDFLRYIESANPLFGEVQQEREFELCVDGYWRSLFSPVYTAFGEDTKKWGDEAWQLLKSRLTDDKLNWTYGTLESTGEHFGAKVVKRYEANLKRIADFLFDKQKLPRALWAELLGVVERMYTQAWIASAHRTGVVLMGFGEKEQFPQLIDLTVGPVICGKLRWHANSPIAIDHDCESAVAPFAQRQVIDMFYRGVQPALLERIMEVMKVAVEEGVALARAGAAATTEVDVDEIIRTAGDALMEHIGTNYRAPLLDAVASLPLHEMGVLAKALVNLTAFRAHLSTDDNGTVGGDIDVAIISKAEGFVWVEKKQLMAS